MARFVGLKWDDATSSWTIILRERSLPLLAERAERWMHDDVSPGVSHVAFARVPSKVNVEQFVRSLPPPDPEAFKDCPLCRAGNYSHTLH